jgi:hypothetical protein
MHYSNHAFFQVNYVKAMRVKYENAIKASGQQRNPGDMHAQRASSTLFNVGSDS